MHVLDVFMAALHVGATLEYLSRLFLAAKVPPNDWAVLRDGLRDGGGGGGWGWG